MYIGDPRWNTGLNSLGPTEKQQEEEREQGGQDQREYRGILSSTILGTAELKPSIRKDSCSEIC